MSLIFMLLDAYSLIVIISALLSWFPVPRNHPMVLFLYNVTEPVYEPIRKVLNPAQTGGLDLSPLVVLFAIQLLKQLLIRLL